MFWCARKFEPQDFDTLGSLDPTGSRDSGTNKKRQTQIILLANHCLYIIIHNLSAHEICMIIGSSSTHSQCFFQVAEMIRYQLELKPWGGPRRSFLLGGVLGVKNHDWPRKKGYHEVSILYQPIITYIISNYLYHIASSNFSYNSIWTSFSHLKRISCCRWYSGQGSTCQPSRTTRTTTQAGNWLVCL